MRVNSKKAVLFTLLSLLVSTAASNAEAGKIAIGQPAAAKKVEVSEASFKCLHNMQKTGKMYVDNLLGDLDRTLAVAQSANGGTFPPGSVVQLLPGEAMVKLEQGANPATNDWKFFVLDISAEGSAIQQAGFEKVANPLGTCISCHRQASAPKADMICAAGHACPPVAFPGISDTEALISALQKMDPRCPRPDLLTDKEKIALKKFAEVRRQLEAARAGGRQ